MSVGRDRGLPTSFMGSTKASGGTERTWSPDVAGPAEELPTSSVSTVVSRWERGFSTPRGKKTDATSTSLVEIGRSLTQRVSDLMGDTSSPLPRWEREDAAGKEISGHVATALAHQREINRVNMKFHGLNYAMNVANTLANRELREKVAAEERRTSILESSLAECTVTIESLNNSVAHLEDESGEHRTEAERLRATLEKNAELLNATREQYEADRLRHEQELARQCRLISHLHTRKVRQDAVVDAVLAGIAFTLVNTTLIDGPIRLALMMVPRRRLRDWLRQVLKTGTGITLIRYMRAWAQAIGWHQSIGAVAPYATELLTAIKGLVRVVPAIAPPKWVTSNCDSRDDMVESD